MEDRSRKRLGQFFSGEKVSKLLVELTAPAATATVIDPMAGQGDLLAAAIEAGVCASNVYGIEIDPSAGQICKERLPSSHVTIADAFLKNAYLPSNRSCWDVVITNPPYVRYQSQSVYDVHGVVLQDAASIRTHLIEIIRGLSHLNDPERACMVKIAESYSGLSDLAVPSWILCASLVARGGTLAMVVPESWLNREYALAVKYLLLKFFDIEYIVEDTGAAWFRDALVKTNLVVARRVAYRKSLMERQPLPYKKIRLCDSVSGRHSLVENLTFNKQEGRSAFSALMLASEDVSGVGFSICGSGTDVILHSMLSNAAFGKFCRRVNEPSYAPLSAALPKELCSAIHVDALPVCRLSSIQAWGIHIGQGLRTGANKFFYAESTERDGETETVKVNPIFSRQSVKLKSNRVLSAFRYQSDAGDSLVIQADDLTHRLLYIQASLTADETELASHISAADSMELTSAGRITRFRDLSAVKPNIRESNVDGRLLQRDWYMLPPLMPRHRPDLCISRVNHKRTRCLYNPERVVVDANFSTLWADAQEPELVYAMFAMMNSNWTGAYLETISTVMGGGALKVEAAHLRQLVIPTVTEERKKTLAYLGKRLATATADESAMVTDEIDGYLLKAITGREDISRALNDLKSYRNRKIASRLRRREDRP